MQVALSLAPGINCNRLIKINVFFLFALCFQARTDLGLDDRLTLEGSMVLLDRVSGADAGVFKITDILGFTVSYVHLKVKRKDEEGRSCGEKSALW